LKDSQWHGRPARDYAGVASTILCDFSHSPNEFPQAASGIMQFSREIPSSTDWHIHCSNRDGNYCFDIKGDSKWLIQLLKTA